MIYHITAKAAWRRAEAAKFYKPESLVAEGFIHCSTEDQILKVANFYYKGRPDVILLEIDESLVEAKIQWEGEGHQKFPHIYGPLNVTAVRRVADMALDEKGEFQFPFAPVFH